MRESMMASATVISTGVFGDTFRNTGQTAKNLTVSGDNSLERTPPSIEADMNS
jgi:hypothetical protein